MIRDPRLKGKKQVFLALLSASWLLSILPVVGQQPRMFALTRRGDALVFEDFVED